MVIIIERTFRKISKAAFLLALLILLYVILYAVWHYFTTQQNIDIGLFKEHLYWVMVLCGVKVVLDIMTPVARKSKGPIQ